MSHLILMDESNGNGLMNVLQASTNTTTLVTSLSNEDLSQSLSEYTDADESMSAPTEYLAEFLSAVMIKDYTNALKYCTLILQFEPNNATAKEFHPLILEKLKRLENPSSSDSDENDNTPSKEGDVELGNSHKSNIGGSGGSEISGSCSNASESEYSNTSSDSSDEKELDVNSNHSNHSIPSDSSDNTTHSYSSLLLEEEEDDDDVQQLPANYVNEKIGENLVLADLKDAFNGNYISQSCSDSESPTEPLTQKIAAILRSKCVPKSSET